MPLVHPTALVEAAARLADDVEIGPFCIVGPGVSLGRGVRLISQVVVTGMTEIGEDCVVHAFASLGGPAEP